MKFKNSEMWLSAWVHLHRWALLFELDAEATGKDFAEINLTILCFTFSYTKMSNDFLVRVDKLTK